MLANTELLIVGAGPFGLAMAAVARHEGVDHLVVGRTMESWKSHMPQGMVLRSNCDWHLDPLNIHTIDCYLQEKGLAREDVEPLSRDRYLAYTDWFQRQKGIEVLPSYVQRLDYARGARLPFLATLEDGEGIRARRVVLALGFQYFKHVPPELAALLPEGSYSHTFDLVDFGPLAGKRCLIIGGRQSAFEWAALLHEASAAEVHVSHRHETPQFEPSNWQWVDQLIANTLGEPGWYRRLSPDQRDDLGRRFWAEGRLKLEPWLKPRIGHPSVRIWPRSQVVACEENVAGGMRVTFDGGENIQVDHVVLATGFRVDMDRVPFLSGGNIPEALDLNNGYPVLDECFQTSVPGLFVTSLAAAQDFGPFLGFTVSVGASARVIASALKRAE